MISIQLLNLPGRFAKLANHSKIFWFQLKVIYLKHQCLSSLLTLTDIFCSLPLTLSTVSNPSCTLNSWVFVCFVVTAKTIIKVRLLILYDTGLPSYQLDFAIQKLIETLKPLSGKNFEQQNFIVWNCVLGRKTRILTLPQLKYKWYTNTIIPYRKHHSCYHQYIYIYLQYIIVHIQTPSFHGLLPAWPCGSDGRASDLYTEGHGLESQPRSSRVFLYLPGMGSFHLE